ncbi:hypothetical protein SAMN02745181_0834 [Rubritalea squalenifaciens DSM 18772]|uniref:ATXR3 GYF domain-containing protein n=1 Tax=Rubritalea squalenifaciens DSM 18772 TaxID=1123071 RepID=A0A1M6DU85_9BACT|nr:GYF domain-containing protein [Rubritalea squalenifaciens]SHI76761.1 hypothetical protein SAMN02745181_0834 [Rubritalea squalenifaciens DSM 18772]
MSAVIQQEHPAKSVWYYRRVGREYGPVNLVHLKQLAESGRLDPRLDFIRHDGSQAWLTVAELDAIYEHVHRAKTQVRPEVIAREAWKTQAPIIVVDVKKARLGQWLKPTLAALGLMIPVLCILYWFIPFGGLAPEGGAVTAQAIAWVALMLSVLAYGRFTRWIYDGWRVTNQYGSKVPAWVVALLMWVPGVNYLWNFISVWWWARDFNVIISSHPQYRYIESPSEKWLMAFCIYPFLAPIIHGILLMLAGDLVTQFPQLDHFKTLMAVSVNALIYLSILYRTAKDVSLAVDGIHDLNLRQ